MYRSARLDAPGVLHHIIIRGIERRKIFRNNADKNNFIDRLSKLRGAVTKYLFRKASGMASVLNLPGADSSEAAAAGL